MVEVRNGVEMVEKGVGWWRRVVPRFAPSSTISLPYRAAQHTGVGWWRGEGKEMVEVRASISWSCRATSFAPSTLSPTFIINLSIIYHEFIMNLSFT